MRVVFHGVRGSTPVAGDEYSRTGGHTSCLAVHAGDELPELVLDAGTGLQRLARRFGPRPFTGTILLTHLHWDHLQGLPFFPPADRDDARVTLAQPAQGAPLALLRRSMSPPHFPIGPEGLAGAWRHLALEPGRHLFGPFEVTAREVAHKGGRTFGYRVQGAGCSFAYVPDALDDARAEVLALADGCDLLVRGAPFVAAEAERARAFGHATVERALADARDARVRRVVLTHHAPSRTDDELDAIARCLGAQIAREGLEIAL